MSFFLNRMLILFSHILLPVFILHPHSAGQKTPSCYNTYPKIIVETDIVTIKISDAVNPLLKIN